MGQKFSLIQILALNKLNDEEFVSYIGGDKTIRYDLNKFISTNDICLIFAKFCSERGFEDITTTRLKTLLSKLNLSIYIDFKNCSITFKHSDKTEELKVNGIPTQISHTINNSPKLRRIANFFDIEVTTFNHGVKSLDRIIEGCNAAGMKEKADEINELKNKIDAVFGNLVGDFNKIIDDKISLNCQTNEGIAEFTLDIFNKIKVYLYTQIFIKLVK